MGRQRSVQAPAGTYLLRWRRRTILVLKPRPAIDLEGEELTLLSRRYAAVKD